MNITENKEVKRKLIKLAIHKSTGRPKELADILSVCERNLYRIIEAIKDEGINIRYSRPLKSYIID
ncbi:hypothetical protein [Marinifilum sp. D714]|uniref:hypothetical protein n=1 Tax=Marinifilum sp. D714 TaxID=2937523 RepID=UPI0027BF96C2|nr:hypothetical protein [Marinifilum sp. D714]MDQ2179397.1 hypothetical protein [Marinifilum sp. D714]